MWTNEETINTGISIDTVNESKWKPHNIFNDSESIHLKRLIDTGILLNPTSKKAVIANNVVISIKDEVIKCDPLTPSFLPKNPEDIEESKGKIIIVKYILYILLLYYLLIYKKLLKFLKFPKISTTTTTTADFVPPACISSTSLKLK